MNKKNSIIKNLDWVTILLYCAIVFIGLLNIYAAVYNEDHHSIFSFSQEYGKQVIWIGASFVLATIILMTDSKVFTSFAIPIFILIILTLMAVLVVGVEIKGARSWFAIGSFRIQPAEFGKFATCLAVASIMSRSEFKVMKFTNLLLLGFIIFLPAALIILQNDTGSALVYTSFILVLYREGLHGFFLLLALTGIIIFITTLLLTPIIVSYIIVFIVIIVYTYYKQNMKHFLIMLASVPLLVSIVVYIKWFNLELKEIGFVEFFVNTIKTSVSSFMITYILLSVFSLFYIFFHQIKRVINILGVSWLCIGASFAVDTAFQSLQPHQQIRIKNLLGVDIDIYGAGYNVHQSKIAIGSGGLIGKGFLEGTQTKYNFVPEQSTDFIFCTVGEEWGFVGSTFLLTIFIGLILRILYLAEKQRSKFSRIYGYGVASILFFHVTINIGMTIGLAPVMGIPLPFISYGGSSLWAFTILLFIFLRLDANRTQIFR